jgi:predicted ArsR family transcriptional regulator
MAQASRREASEIDRVVEALRDPTRRRILLDLHAQPGPQTVDEVASSAGIHRTVAFAHLERLAAAGFLEVDRRRGLRGKPAKLYRAAGGPLRVSYPQRRFGTLAALLGIAIDELGEEGRAAARRAGEAFGAEQSRMETATSDRRGALEALAFLGADYHLVGEAHVTARNCVFKEACDSSHAAVCQLHAGILEGAFRRAGLELRVVPAGLEGPSGCGFELRPVLGDC